MSFTLAKTEQEKFDRAIDIISRHTQFNDHCQALALGAAFLEEEDLQERAEILRKYRDEHFGLGPDKMCDWHGIYKELMERAKKKLPKPLYDQFYRAY